MCGFTLLKALNEKVKSISVLPIIPLVRASVYMRYTSITLVIDHRKKGSSQVFYF